MSSSASPAVPGDGTAAEALQAYCTHFAARRADELVGLFADHALVEIPLLPHHVRGAEVAPTLEAVVATLRTCEVTLRNFAETGRVSIGEGHLEAETVEGPLGFDFAILVEVDHCGRIVRLSEYFDTDPIKPLD